MIPEDKGLSKAEATVYDRQLRVWGIEVQKRLQQAKVLLIGCEGLGAEIAKNIVLAGVGNVTLLGNSHNSHPSLDNFLIEDNSSPDHSVSVLSAISLREMNPFVNVTALPEQELDKTLLNSFDLVVYTNSTLSDFIKTNLICRDAKVKFLCAKVAMLEGWIFADLGNHEFSYEDERAKRSKYTFSYVDLETSLKTDIKTLNKKIHPLYYCIRGCLEYEKKNGSPPELKDIEEVASINQKPSWKFLRHPEKLKNMISRYVAASSGHPACNAVLGGLVANEIVRIVSCNGEPLKNFCFYSMIDSQGVRQEIGL